MPDEMQNLVNEFVIDLCRLAARLDVIGREHDASSRLAVVRAAREVYDALLKRQHTLALTTEDAEMIQTLLDRIRARLKFLS